MTSQDANPDGATSEGGSGATRGTAPLSLAQVLFDEYCHLRSDWQETLEARFPQGKTGALTNAALPELLPLVHQLQTTRPLSALCFSGGGIRSATFNLGVLQGLWETGRLLCFDYLSSVSGGGYIASWFSALRKRSANLGHELTSPRLDATGPLEVEPRPIRHLRTYSNYLTPRLGFLSADTWTSVAMVARNLVLNWLVLLPILAMVLTVPLLAIADWGGAEPDPDRLFRVALVLLGVALVVMNALRGRTAPERDDPTPQQTFVAFGLLPLFGATGLLVVAAHAYTPPPSLGAALRPMFVMAVGVPLIAFAVAWGIQWAVARVRPQEFVSPGAFLLDALALLFAGLLETVIYAAIWVNWVYPLQQKPSQVYALVAPALVLAPLLLGKTLFVAFASFGESMTSTRARLKRESEYGDAQREWWARWSAWTLIALFAWMVLAALAYFSPWVLHHLWVKGIAAAGSVSLGTLIGLVGRSAKTPGHPESSVAPSGMQRALPWAVPVFCVLLLSLIALASQRLLENASDAVGAWGLVTIAAATTHCGGPLVANGFFLVCAMLLAVGFAIVMGFFVNVNRFSLHALYRNRLVRAYLGASNANRAPNQFTGFDPKDNLRLHELKNNRPLPIINMTLNLASGQNLAWQERKAESFTATPLHSGAADLGFRPTNEYGGPDGLSLGTAVAISGAAANPNMGYNSSPAVAFVMALLNMRLGAWLGNPGPAGRRCYSRNGPRSSWYCLLLEMLGQSSADRGYVNLSDGGHFENLGLYEMVRRRCHFIVVSDAGQDKECTFADLGNAIRKIRIDLGVSIDFGGAGIPIFPKADPPHPGGGYSAIGSIHYRDVDGDVPDGVLIYLKPAIRGGEPYDVYNYARSSADFPHETTADQWFNESQFESYRTLGREAVRTVWG